MIIKNDIELTRDEISALAMMINQEKDMNMRIKLKKMIKDDIEILTDLQTELNEILKKR